MGEHSSSRVTPISAILLTYAGKSLSIERVGQVWLPIGRPSGFPFASPAFAARIASAPERTVALAGRDPRGIARSPSATLPLTGSAWRRFGQVVLCAIGTHPRFGNQPRIFASESGQYLPLVADEQHTLLVQLLVLCHELLRHS